MRGLAGLSQVARAGAAAMLLLAAAPAQAEDGGLFGFLRALGGGDNPQPAAAPPAPATPRTALRPLTVRRSKPRHPVARAAGASRALVARRPGKIGPVSIYDDPTLRSGDAVMTRNGMRVFQGAHFSPDRPYSDTDFVAVSASKAINPNLRKTVTDLNKLPHG